MWHIGRMRHLPCTNSSANRYPFRMMSGLGPWNRESYDCWQWRHLANTVERLCATSMGGSATTGGDAAYFQITLGSLVNSVSIVLEMDPPTIHTFHDADTDTDFDSPETSIHPYVQYARQWHGHGLPRKDAREEVYVRVAVGVMECNMEILADFLARSREEIACVGHKTVAVLGELESVSVWAPWNASLTAYCRTFGWPRLRFVLRHCIQNVVSKAAAALWVYSSAEPFQSGYAEPANVTRNTEVGPVKDSSSCRQAAW